MAAERASLLERWGEAAETEAFLSQNLTVVQEQLALAPRCRARPEGARPEG
jgi:hypothetical protein